MNVIPGVAIVLEKLTQHFIVWFKESVQHLPCLLGHGEVLAVLAGLDPFIDIPIGQGSHAVPRTRRGNPQEVIDLQLIINQVRVTHIIVESGRFAMNYISNPLRERKQALRIRGNHPCLA